MTDVVEPVLRFSDDVGNDVFLDDAEAQTLWQASDGLDPVTVSACLTCRSRVVSTIALIDLLAESLANVAPSELVELSEDATSAHIYVVDLTSECMHRTWRDPLAETWAEVVRDPRRRAIR